MTYRQNRQERIHTLTEKALNGYANTRAERQCRLDQPPRPGDLFTLAETAALPVEWLVLGPDPVDPRRLLAVAADLNPLVGGTDIAVPAKALSGPLSIRCAFATRLAAQHFEPARRSGFLESEYLDEVQRKRAEIEAGALTSSITKEATRSDPEYEDWLEEVLEPARATLLEISHRRESAAPDSGRALHSRRAPKWGSFNSLYRLAASILLASTLGFLGGVFWQDRHKTPEPLIDLPVALFGSAGTVRGKAHTLEIPPTASHFLVLLEVNTRYPTYRLEFRQQGVDTELWTSDVMLVGERELSVALPRRLFSTGEYQLRLYGLDGPADLLEEYVLHIEIE